MILFLVILSVLIIFHELGHFIAAKQLGVKVEKFSLGFGPKLLSRKIGDTIYMICAIPFGGFIKMAGDSAQEKSGSRDEFLSRGPGHRARIIFAGPFFNYILAFFCLWIVFFLGYPRSTSKIGELLPGMPAESAGLKAGDTILQINGEDVKFWEDVSGKIHRAKGASVLLKVDREGKEFDVELTPKMKEVETIFGKKIEVGLIGITPSEDIIKVRYGFWEAMIKGFQNLIQMTKMTLSAIFYMIIGTMSFKESVTGPLGIFFIATNAAKIGFSAVVHVVGILSMSLAIFNLLPLPILDGGHIFLAWIERMRGRPLPVKVEETINNVGLTFLITLAVFIFCNDFVRYGYWDRLSTLFSR